MVSRKNYAENIIKAPLLLYSSLVFYRWCLSILLIAISYLGTFGQSNFSNSNFHFEHFKLPSGIMSNQVQQIIQDKNDFLWIATKNGLLKYDGRNFKAFRHDPEDPNSLPNDLIESLLFDKEGMLWIGTYGGGLIKFDPALEQILQIFKHTPGTDDFDDYVYKIIEDHQDNIWVGTSNGLFLINKQTKALTTFREIPNNPNTLACNIIWGLYQDRQGTIWVGTGFPWAHNPKQGGLHRFNPTDSSFTRYLHDPADPTSIADNRVRTIYEDHQNNFWVGTMGEGLHLMDRTKGTFQRLGKKHVYPLNLNRPVVQDPNFQQSDFSQITFVHEDHLNRLWVGAFNGGLNIFDPATNQQIHFEAQENNKNGLSTNFLFSLFEAADQTVFICSGDNGDNKVTKISYSTNLFKTIKLPKKDNRFGYVQCMVEDLDENIWVGTMYGEGLFKWNPKTNRIDTHPNQLKHKNINSLSIDHNNQIWVGYNEAGLDVIDATTGKIVTDSLPKDLLTQLSSKTINTVFEDQYHRIWIPTRFQEMFLLNKDGAFRPLPYNATKDITIDRIFEDENDIFWLFGNQEIHDGIFSLIIDRYDLKNGTVSPLLTEKQEQGFIPSLVGDKAGNFWFTNALDGIKKYNPTTNTIQTINTANSRIPSDEIRALLIDEHGILWLTTRNQVVSFNPKNYSFKVFGLLDGVDIELSFGAILKRKNGHLLFGGKNGFLELDPTKIDSSEQFKQPKVKISELNVNNKTIDPTTSSLLKVPIWNTPSITLAPNENSFALGLTCLDYHSTNNYIEYFLEDYDTYWRKVGPEQQAIYVNVPAGQYTFKTRGANQSGGWNPNGQSLQITVETPWWRTWWAYTIATLAITAILLGFYRFQLNRQKIKQETQNLRALDALKTKLYANITHEFRTPLTLILGLAKQIKNQGSNIDPSIKAATIQKSGQQLLLLVNQLLDLRKLEAGQERLDLVQGNVIPLFHFFFDNFESLAESRAIALIKQIDLTTLIMDHDRDKLNKVVANLLANALKFTDKGGKVILKVQEANQHLLISVKDTGIGISADQLPQIFDRFYRTESATHVGGTGIGLALTKELVQLMKGQIDVQSIPKVGSEFIVRIPISNQAILVADAPSTKLSEIYTATPSNTTLSTIQTDAHQAIILIIEDNTEVAHFTAACLQDIYTIHFAKDGLEGEAKAIELVPDLIISDVMMPHKNGFQLCETLKLDERTSHIPIILLTARADFEDKLVGLKRGADAYLAKPFDEQELNIRVEQLILQRTKLKARYAGLTLQQPSTDEALKIEDEFVLKIRALIEANLDNDNFGVEDISKAIFLSRAQVHRKLKALTQKSTGQFIRAVRLHHALQMIQQTNQSITAIAYNVGFKDPAYFSRVFSEEFGRPPSQIKRN